jgi:hypothetical protein
VLDATPQVSSLTLVSGAPASPSAGQPRHGLPVALAGTVQPPASRGCCGGPGAGPSPADRDERVRVALYGSLVADVARSRPQPSGFAAGLPLGHSPREG